MTDATIMPEPPQEEQGASDTSSAAEQPKTENVRAADSVAKSSEYSDRVRVAAAMGYIPFLCFVPLLIADKGEFSLFHARQGIVITLITLVMAVAGPALTIFVPFIGAVIALCLNAVLALMIILGAWRAYQGEMWELPIVGGYAKNIKI